MPLRFRGAVELPRHATGGFDHGDVHHASGRVFLAHTANGTVEVVDGERLTHLATIPGCPEASGILCAQEEGLVFAAARAGASVLVLEAETGAVRRTLAVGPKPNGLAWDPRRRRLLVADVEDFQARLLSADDGTTVGQAALPGRPRWCSYDRAHDRFLVNIREPACVAVLDGETAAQVAQVALATAGPHGLDLDEAGGRAFVACDGGAVVVLDLATGNALASTPIAGEPDAVWYNPRRRCLYVAIGRPGLVEVVDGQQVAVREQLATEAGAHTTAFDPVRQQLYVFLPQSCRVAVYTDEPEAGA